MPKRTLLNFAATLAFPRFPELYSRLDLDEIGVDSLRKALVAVKQAPPDFIVAEFVYGWGNNYASCHIGNIDSLLASLPKYAPQARAIVVAQRSQLVHAKELAKVYPLHAIVSLPASEADLEAVLK